MTTKKVRPQAGTAALQGDSQRNIAIKLGMSRRWIWQAMKIAAIPEAEFDRMVESDHPPTIVQMLEVAQHRATSERHCPHCGGAI